MLNDTRWCADSFQMWISFCFLPSKILLVTQICLSGCQGSYPRDIWAKTFDRWQYTQEPTPSCYLCTAANQVSNLCLHQESNPLTHQVENRWKMISGWLIIQCWPALDWLHSLGSHQKILFIYFSFLWIYSHSCLPVYMVTFRSIHWKINSYFRWTPTYLSLFARVYGYVSI